MIKPGNSAPLSLNITPSQNSQYGNPVELHVRIREGDASAVTEVTLPLRVAKINDFMMSNYGNWEISKNGGKSLITLENLGNSPTTITLQVLSLPDGWVINGKDKMVLSAGQKAGIPIDIVPSENWNGDIKTIRILAQDPEGNQREILIETKYVQYSWSSSPVIISIAEDYALINIHGASNGDNVIDEEGNNLDWTENGWLLPTAKNGFGNITINQNNNLMYLMEIYQPILRNVSCQISGLFEEINSSCSIESGNEIFGYTVLLIDDMGNAIDSYFGTSGVNSESITINLSSDNWDPLPGMRKLTIKIFDQYGREMTSAEKNFEIRKSNWNIGLTSVDLSGTGDNQIIEITAERFGHGQLIDAECKISLSGGDYESVQKIDMSTRVILTPKPKFDRPLEIEDGTEIRIKIECLFPWDIDSNPADNEIRKVLTGGEVSEEGFNTLESIISAIAVILISLSLAWINKNRKEMKEFEEITKQTIQRRVSEQKNADKSIKIKNDEITENINENNKKDDAYVDDLPNEDIEPEVENKDEEVLDDFERRLRRIRRND